MFIQMQRIFMLIIVHLAAFHPAFSTKTPFVLHQNALHLAPKCTAFSTKTHSILQQIAPKLVQMAVALNVYSFSRIHMLTLFCSKTNHRENRFFAARRAIGHDFRSHSVKGCAENITLSCVC